LRLGARPHRRAARSRPGARLHGRGLRQRRPRALRRSASPAVSAPDDADGPASGATRDRAGRRRLPALLPRVPPARPRAPPPACPPPPAPLVAEHRLQLLLVQRANGGLTIGDTHAYQEPFDFALDEAPYRHLTERAEALLGTPVPPVARRWAGVYSECTDGRV